MLAAKIYNDKDTKSYMRTQFRSFKKNHDLLTSEDILNNIRVDIAKRFNTILPVSSMITIKIDKENSAETIITDIAEIMSKYYEDMDIQLLFRFFVIDKAVVVQKKR